MLNIKAHSNESISIMDWSWWYVLRCWIFGWDIRDEEEAYNEEALNGEEDKELLAE